MNVATRITMATAVVVAIASLTYAVFDLRTRRLERRTALERETRAVATALRFSIEGQPAMVRAPGEMASKELQRAGGGWKVTVLSAARASGPVTQDASEAQLRRLNAMILVP